MLSASTSPSGSSSQRAGTRSPTETLERGVGDSMGGSTASPEVAASASRSANVLGPIGGIAEDDLGGRRFGLVSHRSTPCPGGGDIVSILSLASVFIPSPRCLRPSV